MVTFSPVQVSPLTNEDRSGEGALYPWVRLGPERNAVKSRFTLLGGKKAICRGSGFVGFKVIIDIFDRL